MYKIVRVSKRRGHIVVGSRVKYISRVKRNIRKRLMSDGIWKWHRSRFGEFFRSEGLVEGCHHTRHVHCIRLYTTHASLEQSTRLSCCRNAVHCRVRPVDLESLLLDLNPGLESLVFAPPYCFVLVRSLPKWASRNIADVNGRDMPKPSRRGHVTGRGNGQSLEIVEEAEV